MNIPDITLPLQQLLNEPLAQGLSREAITALLQQKINGLLLHNFQGLISLLYRVDISEERLRYQLKLQPQNDAALIIAELIIDRLIEKSITKQQFKNNGPVSDEEKW